MSKHLQTPNFSIAETQEILKSLYNIEAILKKLDGERDLNFMVNDGHEKFVFKIANQDERADMLDCQHQAFDLLTQQQVFKIPVQAIKSINNKTVESVKSATGYNHFCRLLPYVEGTLLSSVQPRSPQLYFDLGSTLGKLDLRLTEFSHSGLDRDLLWNLSDTDLVLNRFSHLISISERKNIIEYFQQRFKNNVLPVQNELPESVIHNDANDNNVIVNNTDPNNQSISCLIDFGDMIKSWRIAEPSIAIAYSLLDDPGLEDCFCAIAEGYNQQIKLSDTEISVIFDLVAARLCMSVTIGAWQQQLQPNNDYLKISEQPAWSLLHRLAETDSEEINQMLRSKLTNS